MITSIIPFFLILPYNEIIAEGKIGVHNTNQEVETKVKLHDTTATIHRSKTISEKPLPKNCRDLAILKESFEKYTCINKAIFLQILHSPLP